MPVRYRVSAFWYTACTDSHQEEEEEEEREVEAAALEKRRRWRMNKNVD